MIRSLDNGIYGACHFIFHSYTDKLSWLQFCYRSMDFLIQDFYDINVFNQPVADDGRSHITALPKKLTHSVKQKETSSKNKTH